MVGAPDRANHMRFRANLRILRAHKIPVIRENNGGY